MEMGNDYMPELHVAQQRRRDKLRVQQFEDLHHNNFNNNSSSIVFPTEMLNFPASQSTQFANVHPLRFVPPSSSDSCDPQPLQTCDDWVSNYGEQGRRNLMTPHHFSARNNNNNNNSNNEVLAAHYYPNNVHGWESGENSELHVLPTFASHGNDSSALSLSLSSNQIREMHRFSEPRELKPLESGSISSVVKLDSGKSQMQDVVAPANHLYRNVGPLGPFTGYATILRGSKFLKPAQILLDEILMAAGLRHVRGSEEVESVPTSTVLGPRFFGSNNMSTDSASGDTFRPNCDENKAKLLHMQEEVCKRHKQYHQQMEMVVSAFESVPGLSNATPYISRSLKTISRNFRSLKNAIADQIRLIKRTLGEDISAPTSYIKSDNSCSMFDQSIVKVKTSSVGGSGYGGGHQSHIWRPQRGLPERAVSVLRAWLFDHFLHPYPTDTDKQMLASQTGLSRNQVSNWFINARVRIWKPMVEEIHMLETKSTGCSDANANHKLAVGSHKPVLNAAICDAKQLDRMGSSSYMETAQGESHTEKLHQKTSRVGSHHIPPNMDSFHGFPPYDRRGLELGSLGAVSLTLGLRHGSETTHQHQLQNQYQYQGLQLYGGHGHVMHDFTG